MKRNKIEKKTAQKGVSTKLKKLNMDEFEVVAAGGGFVNSYSCLYCRAHFSSRAERDAHENNCDNKPSYND